MYPCTGYDTKPRENSYSQGQGQTVIDEDYRLGRVESNHSIHSNLDPRANRSKPMTEINDNTEYVPRTVDKYIKSSLTKGMPIKS